MELLYTLDATLSRPTILSDPADDPPQDCTPEGLDVGSVVMRTASRLFKKVLPAVGKLVGGCMARLPLTRKDVKANILTSFHIDKGRAVKSLGAQGSEARRTFAKLHLDRPTDGVAHTEFRNDGPAQVALNSLICATRLKFFDEATPGAPHST